MKYCNIVFLQDSEADEALEIFNELTEKAVEYLAQWDYGEYHDLTENLGNGTCDKLYYVDNYILIVNEYCGYIGLSIELDENDLN